MHGGKPSPGGEPLLDLVKLLVRGSLHALELGINLLGFSIDITELHVEAVVQVLELEGEPLESIGKATNISRAASAAVTPL